MKDKKAVLITVAYLVELPELESNLDDRVLDIITNRLSESQLLEIEGRETLLQWKSSSSLVLDSETLNCDKCSNCGQWTTDREKSDAIEGISNGATVNGKLICDECLPSDHKWTF